MIVMMRKHNIRTLDQKEAIWAYYQKNGWKATAKKYKLSYQTLVHWRARVKAADPSVKHPLARKIKKRTIRKETAELVKKIHNSRPTLSISQIREMVLSKQNISRTTVWHILQGHWHPVEK